MSKSNTFENDLLKLIYNATAIANIADNAAAAPLTNIFWALHTADPGEAGDQTTSEAAYTSYARVSVARTTGGHTVTNNSVSPVAQVTFPAATGGASTCLFFSTGVAASGASKILHRGPIGSKLGPFTAIALGDVITIPGLTGLAVNDRIVFFPGDPAGLPSGLTEGTVYHVISVSTNDITVSLTSGGAAVDITAAGDGIAFKVTPLTVTSGITPALSASTTITED